MARPSIILKFEHDCKAMKRTLRKLKATEISRYVTQRFISLLVPVKDFLEVTW